MKGDIASSFSGSGSNSETKTQMDRHHKYKKSSLRGTYNEGSEEADYRWNHLRYPFHGWVGPKGLRKGSAIQGSSSVLKCHLSTYIQPLLGVTTTGSPPVPLFMVFFCREPLFMVLFNLFPL